MELAEKRAIVVGASSGIGEAAALELMRRGWTVALVARREEKLRAIADKSGGRGRVYAHDVADFDAVPGLFDRIVDDLGGVSMVVFAAGVMPQVEEDEYDFEKDRQMVDVNLLGCMAWLNESARLFTRLQAGTIVGVGSIAGDRGRRGQPAYNTSKGAQAIYLECLRNRLDRHGVRVVTIKPGYVDTEMTAGMGDLLWMISAREAGRRVVDAAMKSRGTVYVPRRWRFVALVLRHIPSFIFRKINI